MGRPINGRAIALDDGGSFLVYFAVLLRRKGRKLFGLSVQLLEVVVVVVVVVLVLL